MVGTFMTLILILAILGFCWGFLVGMVKGITKFFRG